MTPKTRILLFLVHTIARIQGVFLGVRRIFRRVTGTNTTPAGPERVLILNDEGPYIEFMHVAYFADKIIEQYGVVGQLAPRETHAAALRDNIGERVEELIEDGYIPAAEFPGLSRLDLSGPVPIDAGDAFMKEIGDYLADRGLGLVGASSSGAGRLTLTLDVTDSDLARPLIEDFLKREAYVEFTMS